MRFVSTERLGPGGRRFAGRRTAVAAAALLAACGCAQPLFFGTALAQSTDSRIETGSTPEAATPAASRVAAGEVPAAPAVERDPPPLDPLTPPRVELPPAAAPAPVTTSPAGSAAGSTPATGAPPATADRSPRMVEALALVRQQLADPATTRGAAAEDRAALGAFYAERTELVWTGPDGLSRRGASVTTEIARAGDWGLDAAAFEAPGTLAADAPAADIAAAEVRIGLAVLKYARHARGGRIPEPSALSKMIDMKPRFFAPRTVLDAIAVTDDPGAYLTGLHPQHAGFRRLQKTLVALRTGTLAPQSAPATAASGTEEVKDQRSAKKGKAQPEKEKPARQLSRSEKETRIVVNMERWRWLPDDLGAFHVVNNVPEQITRTYLDGNPVFSERIVVGKSTTPTPMFSADMRFVIFHPTWGVPDGIKSNELGPALRRASGGGGWGWFGGGGDGAARVLERHNLRVYSGGREINPNNVDWSSVDPRRFSFVQPPGSKNVLGVVKFRFPNRHDVYMHDTQEKGLFAHSVRAYSHGCMRVQNPIRFAEVLLAQGKGWTSDRVQAQLGRSGPIDITLDKPIPVHNVYFTAAADDAGTLKLFGDLYGMDGRIASALAGRPVHLAAAAAPAPEAGAKREVRRSGGGNSGSGSSGATSSASAGGYYNPFSGLTGN